MFEYPPCLHGLIFNEVRGVCDYADNLTTSNSGFLCNFFFIFLENNCPGGHNHGEHIGHTEICSLFYRCVWGRLFPMNCPDGTAFNSQLSICDYPEKVPNCKKL
jgi:hypothetical protein